MSITEPAERPVEVLGLRYVLRATPSPDGSWRATATSMTAGLGDGVSYLRDDALNPLGIVGNWAEDGPTADAALSALEQRIRGAITAAVAEAKHDELAEANRRLQERNARRQPPT